MMPSKFTLYWKRIDNTPGSLDKINPAQFRELKKMVKEAFHAGQHESQKRIAELEADCIEWARLNEIADNSNTESEAMLEKRIAALEAFMSDLQNELCDECRVQFKALEHDDG